MVDFGRLLSALLEGVGYTILVASSAYIVGLLLAFPIALARISHFGFLRAVAGGFVEIVRGIPTLCWVFLGFYALQPFFQMDAVVAASIMLGIVASANIAENYRSGFESVTAGQLEASDALAFTRWQRFVNVIFPQGLGIAVPSTATYAVGLLKDSAFASIIGVSDITFEAMTEVQVHGGAMLTFLLAGVVYLLLSVPVALATRSFDGWVRVRMAS